MADEKTITQADIDKAVADAVAAQKAADKEAIDNAAFNFWGVTIPRKFAYGLIVLIGLYGVKQNWWTLDSIQSIISTPGLMTSTATTTVKTTETGPNPPAIVAPVDPRIEEMAKQIEELKAAKAAASAPKAISPEDLQKWIELLKPIIVQIVDIIPKPPVVTPPVTPPIVKPPVVNPPDNPPVVIPPSSGMKLVLTDSSKTVITASSVPINRIHRVMVTNAASKVGWTIATHGNVDVYDLPNDLGYDFDLRDLTSYVDITCFDATLEKVTQRVTANQAPQPPPVDPPVVVTPPVIPPGTKTFDIYVVEDPTKMRSVATAKILNNLPLRDQIAEKGHKFAAQVITDGSGAAEYVKSQGTALPSLALFDRESAKWVKSVPLPSDLGLSLLAGMGG